MNERVIGYRYYATRNGRLEVIHEERVRRTFPWLQVLHWTVWIALLLTPAAVIVHYELATRRAEASQMKALHQGEAAEAREVKALEKQIGRRIGDLP